MVVDLFMFFIQEDCVRWDKLCSVSAVQVVFCQRNMFYSSPGDLIVLCVRMLDCIVCRDAMLCPMPEA